MIERRVLIEVPYHALSEHAEPKVKSARWCDREPYSLQCLYKPWTPGQTAHYLLVRGRRA
jgi:hypothetical protein